MARRRKEAQPETEAPETEAPEAEAPEERSELSNSAARATTIREACQTIEELDRQIDGLKSERKAVIDTRIVADLGMKKAHFATAYKLYQLDHDERDSLQDTIRECFAALGIGEQLSWLDADEAPVDPEIRAARTISDGTSVSYVVVRRSKKVARRMDEARKAGHDDGMAGNRRRAEQWPAGDYGHADYELGHAEGTAAWEGVNSAAQGDVPAAAEG